VISLHVRLAWLSLLIGDSAVIAGVVGGVLPALEKPWLTRAT
jgi:hypothetical protein